MKSKKNLEISKKKSLNITKKQQGVTLVALIVTIVVLLILTALTVNIVVGDNGIIEQSKKQKEETEKTVENSQEDVKLLSNALAAEPEDKEYYGAGMKVLVNSGSDGVVRAPIQYLQGTINWGDGEKENIDYEKTIEHTYVNKNTEYTIEIQGIVESIYAGSNTKILEILDWGELWAEHIDLSYSSNLTSVASPRTYTFENVDNFDWTFQSCTKLTSIPSDLFVNCQNVTSFEGTFSGCTNLTSIPSNLFENCQDVTNFYDTFAHCTKLTSIPSALFANCPNVTSFDSTFYYCTNLTSIPQDLFANCPKVSEFYQTFAYCQSLTGNSIQLWNETSRNKYGIDESSGGYDCYYDCTNLDDYSTIPYHWGGPEDSYYDDYYESYY